MMAKIKIDGKVFNVDMSDPITEVNSPIAGTNWSVVISFPGSNVELVLLRHENKELVKELSAVKRDFDKRAGLVRSRKHLYE
jgi:hypothetical protein